MSDFARPNELVLCRCGEVGRLLRVRPVAMGHSGREPDLRGSGKVTDYLGRELDLEDEDIVASNGHLHPAMTGEGSRREGM
jgi:hypothetical protein